MHHRLVQVPYEALLRGLLVSALPRDELLLHFGAQVPLLDRPWLLVASSARQTQSKVLTGQGLSSDQSRVIHGAWPQYLTAALADFVKRCSDHNERTKGAYCIDDVKEPVRDHL